MLQLNKHTQVVYYLYREQYTKCKKYLQCN